MVLKYKREKVFDGMNGTSEKNCVAMRIGVKLSALGDLSSRKFILAQK